MKTIVVSLIDSDRRGIITKRLNDAFITFDFFDAIKLELKEIRGDNYFDVNKFINKFKLIPTKQIISCALSHRKVIEQHFLNSSDSLLVLEDDAIVKTTVDELNNLCSYFEKSRFDILLIGMSKVRDIDENHFYFVNPISNEVRINDALYIGERFKLTSSGAVAYIVKKSAYLKIKKKNSKPWFVADEWKTISREYDLKIASTSRLLFTEDFDKLESTLNNHYVESKSILPFLNFKIKFLLKNTYRLILLFILYIKKIFN